MSAAVKLCVCVRACRGVADRGRVRLRALARQSAEDAPLGHLQAGSDGGDPGQRGRQPGHVGLHVAQQLLQLVQHCNDNHKPSNDSLEEKCICIFQLLPPASSSGVILTNDALL